MPHAVHNPTRPMAAPLNALKPSSRPPTPLPPAPPFRPPQDVFRLYSSHPNATLINGSLPPGAYHAALAAARFCLAPYGAGWGVRLGQAVAAGCVPVIVQVMAAA